MAAQQEVQVEFTQVINEIASRIRILEGKQSSLSERLLVMNQNMIEEYKKIIKDIKSIEAKRSNLEEDLEKVKNVIRHLSDEASKFARQDTLKQLQKYVDLWNPLNFVTEGEVEQIVERILEEKKHHHRKKTEEHKKHETHPNHRTVHVPEKDTIDKRLNNAK
jgi:hypothetical protein